MPMLTPGGPVVGEDTGAAQTGSGDAIAGVHAANRVSM